MTDRFTRLLGIQQPIIQAPMLGVSTPALAAAVSNAGGLGSIAITGSAAEKGRALIREVRGLTDQPFNVNLFCHRPAQADPARERAWLDYLKPLFAEFGAEPPTRLKNIYLSFLEDPTLLPMLLEERPAAVSFHFGAPPATRFARCRRRASAYWSAPPRRRKRPWWRPPAPMRWSPRASRPVAIAGCSSRSAATPPSAPWRWSACWRRAVRYRWSLPAGSWTDGASAPPWSWARALCRWAPPSSSVRSLRPTPPTARR